MSYPICGNCLHAHSSHESHGNNFMYCATCSSLCELIDFKKNHKPTDIGIFSEMQGKREYSKYEVKY